MVETATKLPELKLHPKYRSNAEVKFMATLEKPRQVSGIKAGKIPLVRTLSSTKTWPEGNPTAGKFLSEEEHYLDAEDEPYYASKEVERLDDNLGAYTREQPQSDIIERITESRHQRHKQALEDLHEELGHLNKAIDPQIFNHLDNTKEQISWILSEIQILFSGIEKDVILYTYPLKRLQMLWDDVVGLLQKRNTDICSLSEKLTDTERERRDQITELFKQYSVLFHEIAYLSCDAINVLMDGELYSSNLLLLANYNYYANIISQIKLENVVKLRELRGKWEERLATWRDLHIHDTRSKFIQFMGTPAIVSCPDLAAVYEQMKCEMKGLLERRLNKVRTISSLKPPSITCSAVSHWYEDVCSLSLTLENTNSRYLAKLAAIEEKVVADCGFVADKMLLALKEEGVCSDEEGEELKQEELVPLIEAWHAVNRDKARATEREFTEAAAQFNANLHILYDFQTKGAKIWMDYKKAVNSKNNELSAMMKSCRQKHDDINQGLESALDMEMDRMRQDTNEQDLKRNLDRSVEALKEIAGAYDNFKTDMSDVIKHYPGMVLVELEKFASEVRAHLGCTEEQKEEAIEGDNTTLSDSKPDEGTFLTETPQVAQQVAYSDEKFSALQQVLVQIYLDHLASLKVEVEEDSAQNVEEKLSEIKSEVELRHHIHAPRAMRMRMDIFNVRVNELKNHDERVKQHAAGIALEISTLRGEFKDLGNEHAGKGREFKDLVDDCENALPSFEKTAHLTSLQTKVTAAYEEHMNQIKFELSTFRNKMEEKLNDLRESNQHFGLAFKPFAEGGNFGPDEIEKYRKKLEKCNLKIDNCETYILTELDGMESKCLDAAVEITNNFEIKLSMHQLDVAFLEKVNSWMSNCQVRIKTEVAACNMMSKKLKSSIEVLRKLIDSCARPHPDKPTVVPEEVLAAIPSIYQLFQERISYLDCAKNAPAATVKIAQDMSDIASIPDSQDLHSAVSITRNILQLARKSKVPIQEVESLEKKKPVPQENFYDWFIAKEQKEKVVTKRGKSRSDTADRSKRLGSASSRSSMMSVVLTEVQSFLPIIKKILQETQGALFVSSEAYYAQYQGPPLRAQISENLETCMEGLNKRLNNYYLQAEEYFNKCIQELREQLTDVLSLHTEVPRLLFSEILEKYVTEVSQKTAIIKHQFDQNKAKIGDLRETNKAQLKPILGHPNNEVDLNNLCRKEEDRMIRSGDVLNEFVNEMRNTETALAKEFVESVNECVQRLLTLFDQLITTDDVILGKVTEKKLPVATLLKKELRANLESEVLTTGLSKGGQQIRLLNMSDISHDSNSSSKAASVTTAKHTPVHEETVSSKNDVSEEYRNRFGLVMEQLDLISSQWVSSEEKWKRQWVSSVQHVRNLYKPS